MNLDIPGTTDFIRRTEKLWVSGSRPTMMIVSPRIYRFCKASLAYAEQMRRLRWMRLSDSARVRRYAEIAIAKLRARYDNNFRDVE